MAQTICNVITNTVNNLQYNSSNWATARSAASANSYGSSFRVSSVYTTDYSIERSPIIFDTSSIPDTDIITSAILEVYVNSVNPFNFGHSGDKSVCLVTSTPANPISIAAGDYDQFGSTELASRISITSTGIKTYTLNASGLSQISKTSYTTFGLRAWQDLDNSTPIDGSSETSIGFVASFLSSYTRLIVNHYPAGRYWVGGSGNWSDTSHWATSSGGTSGAPVPTSSDSVFFDANSFTASNSTVTIDTTASCLNMDFTGATNSPILTGGFDLNVYGTLTTIATLTWPHSGFLYLQKSGSNTFTSNAVSFAAKVVFGAGGGNWTLGDAFTTTNTFYHPSGTFNSGNFAITCAGFNGAYTNTRTLTLGSSTIACSGNWDVSTATNLTVTATTSTITMSGNNTTFAGGGKAWNNLTLTGTPITITGSNTFATLTWTAAKQVNFTAGTTTTVTSTSGDGTAGNLVTLRSTTPGTQYTISDTTGTNTHDYLDIQDCAASGGATWKPGDNAIDSGNNTGWRQPWTNPGNAYASDNTYATHTSPNGNLYVKLSKDGGTTWQNVNSVTHTGSEDTQTFGLGASELWGTSWIGTNVANANFRMRLYCGSASSFNYIDYYTFGFDGEIASDRYISGIEVTTEAKWDGTTTSLDQVLVKVYSGTSTVPTEAGSIAYATNGGVDGDGALQVYNGQEWEDVEILEGGWAKAGETWTYASADDPTFTFIISGDVTSKYNAGMKVKYTQSQALASLYHMENNSTDSVSAHNGTDTNITYNAGNAKFGSYGAGFNGTTSKIVVSDHADFKPTTSFTVGAWVKTSGTSDAIFTSWSVNTNYAGILLYMNSGGKVDLYSGNNTGTTANTNFAVCNGKTVINDNAWHMVVGVWDGEMLKVYIDGRLDASKNWGNAPAYAATNYVRIGCENDTGTDIAFWAGAIDELFFINGYSLGETNIKSIYDANVALASPLTLTKYGFISVNPTYSNPNTTITIYGGTDYVLSNAAISTPYYSVVKSPQGFPMSPIKWMESISGTSSQASSVQNNWYNGISKYMPIGVWDVYMSVQADSWTSVGISTDVQVSLSTTANTETDAEMTGWVYSEAAGSGTYLQAVGQITIGKIISVTTKTNQIVVFRTTVTNNTSISLIFIVLRFVCAYL